MLEKLNKLNKFQILSIDDSEFLHYGNVIKDLDCTNALNILSEYNIPEEGNLYVTQDDELEKLKLKHELEEKYYGYMPIQLGYCNGNNTTINGLEYHKGSEVIIANSNLVLFLGHLIKLNNDEFNVADGKFFYMAKGSVVEIYQTTLHLSPLKVCDQGYQTIIALPKGTNTDINNNSNDKLLLKRNKWIIAHSERVQLTSQGVHPGLIGENLELKYK